MFLEVEHDHVQSILAALQISSSSDICDKIILVSESGDHIYTSFSFISFFSNLIGSITNSDQDILPLIFLPHKLSTIVNLMSFLSKGEVHSADMECLKDILEAAKNLDIDSQDWLVDIVEKEKLINVEVKEEIITPTKETLNCAKVLVNSSTVALVIPAGFSDIGWSDCEVEYECLVVAEDTMVKLEILPDPKDCQHPDILVPTIVPETEPNVGRKRKRGRPIGSTNRNKELLICPDCPRKFQTPSKLRSHSETTHCKEVFKCDLCQKKFKSKVGLQFHVISYHKELGELNPSSRVCLENIARGSRETDEEVTHSKCPAEVQDSCTTASLLPKNAVQDKNKNFHCSQPGCVQAFRTKQSLNQHVQRCSKLFMFPCHLCENKYVGRSRLIIHLRVHTGETLFSCDFCNTKYSSKEGLRKHTKTIKHLKSSNTQYVK